MDTRPESEHTLRGLNSCSFPLLAVRESPLRFLLSRLAYSQAQEILSHCSPPTGGAGLRFKCSSVSSPPVCHHASPPHGWPASACSRVPHAFLFFAHQAAYPEP